MPDFAAARARIGGFGAPAFSRRWRRCAMGAASGGPAPGQAATRRGGAGGGGGLGQVAALAGPDEALPRHAEPCAAPHPRVATPSQSRASHVPSHAASDHSRAWRRIQPHTPSHTPSRDQAAPRPGRRPRSGLRASTGTAALIPAAPARRGGGVTGGVEGRDAALLEVLVDPGLPPHLSPAPPLPRAAPHTASLRGGGGALT